MSGMVGVFTRSGAPVDPRIVETMAQTTPYREADGSWKIAHPRFSAIRQRTITLPEDHFETGPIVDPVSKLVMIFDGRLDNRDELLQILQGRRPDRATCDAWIALEAWKRWDADAPARLSGDFAFVVWDPAARTVSCARDPMGVRPLFYYLADDVFIFGSEVRQILAHPRVPRSPDEMMIADLLTFGDRSPDRTLYRDIHRLPHARTLVVNATRSVLSRYWQLDASRELKLRGAGEYAAAFRETFDRAVAVRLRRTGPMGAHLSGGLDSSSVVVTARAISDTPIVPFSLVFPGHTECDERQYIDAVLENVRITGVQVTPPKLDVERLRAQIASRHVLPDYPNDGLLAALGGAMAAHGVHVALTGFGGDDGLTGSFFSCADLLARGRLFRFARRYRDVVRYLGGAWYSSQPVRTGFWAALPPRVRHAVRPLARRALAPSPPAWVSPGLVHRTGLTDALPAIDSPAGLAARYHVIQAYENSWNHAVTDASENASAELQIERRHPFYDRRLIEFMVALPDEQRWQQGATKYVLRRAMDGRLPETVRVRSDVSKADFSHTFLDALETLGGEAFFSDAMCIAANDWVIPSRARSLYRRMRLMRLRSDAAYGDLASSLWAIAAVEMWFRGAFTPASNWSTPCVG